MLCAHHGCLTPPSPLITTMVSHTSILHTIVGTHHNLGPCHTRTLLQHTVLDILVCPGQISCLLNIYTVIMLWFSPISYSFVSVLLWRRWQYVPSIQPRVTGLLQSTGDPPSSSYHHPPHTDRSYITQYSHNH